MPVSPNRGISRRQFVWAALAAPLALPQQSQLDQEDVSRLTRPDLAGQRRRITDYENDPFVVGVEQQIRCTCGCNLDVYTCRTTDFTCEFSPAMHREVVALVERDMTAEEILADFVARHGEAILMAPPREGFNLLGYVLPGLAITAVGGTMLWVLLRRTRARAAVTASGDPLADFSEADRHRLEAELADLER